MNWLVRMVLLGTSLMGAGVLLGRLTTLDDFIDFTIGWTAICLFVLVGRWVVLRRARQ